MYFRKADGSISLMTTHCVLLTVWLLHYAHCLLQTCFIKLHALSDNCFILYIFVVGRQDHLHAWHHADDVEMGTCGARPHMIMHMVGMQIDSRQIMRYLCYTHLFILHIVFL